MEVCCCRTLASIPGPRLGALAIQEALKRANVDKADVQEVYMGSVLPAGMGQAPDRQAAIFAGIPDSVPCTMINKVCASGMKAIMMASQSLTLGQNKVKTQALYIFCKNPRLSKNLKIISLR